MEVVAQMFEAEEGMLYEVEQKMKSEPYLWMQTLSSCVKGKYSPYCEVSILAESLVTNLFM